MWEKLNNFHSILATVSGTLILVVTMLIVIDAGGRFLINRPLTGGVEVSILLLSFIVFWGLAYALLRDAHVRVTVITRYLPDNLQEPLEILVYLIGFLFLCFVVYSTGEHFWESWLIRETMRAPIDLPRWLGKLAVTIGFFLFAVQLGVILVTHIRKLFGRS